MYIEKFVGGGVLPNTIMATLRGGGGIKVLKMYYVVCDWSLIHLFLMQMEAFLILSIIDEMKGIIHMHLFSFASVALQK